VPKEAPKTGTQGERRRQTFLFTKLLTIYLVICFTRNNGAVSADAPSPI
jgi:hypothetical protein